MSETADFAGSCSVSFSFSSNPTNHFLFVRCATARLQMYWMRLLRL